MNHSSPPFSSGKSLKSSGGLLFCPDSFKGCLSSCEICRRAPFPSLPLSDGGEGFLDALQKGLETAFLKHRVPACDPLGNPELLPFFSAGDRAYIECAEVVGYAYRDRASLLERDSRGLGLLLRHIAETGRFKQVFIAGGGTGIHDGGVGLLQELGALFLDSAGREVSWKNFEHARHFRPPPPLPFAIHFLCDVQSLFLDSLKLYAPQKGATKEELVLLEKRFAFLASIHAPLNAVGGGVGGGVALAFRSHFKASLESGFDFLASALQLEKAISRARLVLSGEGRLDNSTLQGKVLARLGALCQKQHKELWAICGSWDGHSRPPGVRKILSLEEHYPKTLDPELTCHHLSAIIQKSVPGTFF
jgi:glycerate kinase